MTFQFKTLDSQYAAEWLALRLCGVREFPMGFLTTEEEAASMDENRAKEILGFGFTRGVFEKETLAGFCGYRREQLERTKHRAEVGPFFVAAKFQGSGAADVLMTGVLNEARSERVEQLELFVDTKNFRAIRFYERYGFERIATHIDGVRIDGESRDDYFYNLRI